MEKILGKIASAEFGTNPDRPFLMGLQLEFTFPGSGIGDGGRYTINVSHNCKWGEQSRAEAFVSMVEHIEATLTNAKVNFVSQLKGKPVEVTVDKGLFKDFRILTEVL